MPAKLHSLRAPSVATSALSNASPDTPGLMSHASLPNDGINDHVNDHRPATALSYATREADQSGVEDPALMPRSVSRASVPGNNNTLRKRSTVKRQASLKRSSSRRSISGNKGVSFAEGGSNNVNSDYNNALTTPIPTQGSPTDILANRFQAWRTFLKSLITYFREVQSSHEGRAKAIMKISNVISNTPVPGIFAQESSVVDANRILAEYHKQAAVETNKAREIEVEVIQALGGLRADLGSKIKEIKGLHGDFKNSVEKELENTRRAVNTLRESLQRYEHEDGFNKASSDPFLVRLGVDRQLEKQIDEENYLHRAYLNLESSGRELESIVVGEIQKAYNQFAGILKRDADEAYNVIEQLRSGPISVQKDADWAQFVSRDRNLVNPDLPLRRLQDIYYPGIDHPAAAEIRAGMLERKSKYLKSYTPGWYILSPTHIHEFKSADNIYSQPPVMSLYLGDQKLGSHSGPESSSHKFMLKGRQTGAMHRGHAWVFRAESYDTMLEWYEAIKNLTEKTGAERVEYVRKHARSISGNSGRPTSVASSDGLEEDEADGIPYSASVESLQAAAPPIEAKPVRPAPGGRFPSDLAIPNTAAVARTSESSSDREADPRTPTLARPGNQPAAQPYVLPAVAADSAPLAEHLAVPQASTASSVYSLPVRPSSRAGHGQLPAPGLASASQNPSAFAPRAVEPNPWEGEAAAAGGGAILGAGLSAMYRQQPPAAEAAPPSTVGPSSTVATPEPLSRFSTSTAPSALSAETSATETSRPVTPKPAVARTTTDKSVSELHVPGEFPGGPSKEM